MKIHTQLVEAYDPKDVAIANSTSRTLGAVGAKAITPAYVQKIAEKGQTILDFGAGKDAAHAERLKAAGLNVVAYEFGSNVNDKHDKQALIRKYDIVYASNVLNVQGSADMARTTLQSIVKVMKPGAVFIANFPSEPRKAADIRRASDMQTILEEFFEVVKRVGGTSQAPLWECSRPAKTVK